MDDIANELAAAARAVDATSMELQQVMQSMSMKNQLLRRSELTATELKPLADDHVAYEAVGRMFVRKAVPLLKGELARTCQALEADIVKMKTSQTHLQRTYEEGVSAYKELVAQAAN